MTPYARAILSLLPAAYVPCWDAAGGLAEIVGPRTLALTGSASYGVTGPISREQSSAVQPGDTSSSWQVTADIGLGTGPYTQLCWAKDNDANPGASAKFRLLISTGAQNYMGWRHFTSGARRRLVMSARLDSAQRVLNGDGVGANDAALGWTLVAATWDGTYLKLYADGVLLGTSTSYAGMTLTAHSFMQVGREGTLGSASPIAHVAAWSRVVTVDEQRYLHLAGLHGASTDWRQYE